MGRLLQIWRSWSVALRFALVGGLALVVAGAAVAAYLVTRRPADVSNPHAAFPKQKRTKKKNKRKKEEKKREKEHARRGPEAGPRARGLGRNKRRSPPPPLFSSSLW